METPCFFESKLMDWEEEDPTMGIGKAMSYGGSPLVAEEVRMKASDAGEGSQLSKRHKLFPEAEAKAEADVMKKKSGSKVGETELSSTKSPAAADVEEARRKHQLAAMSLYGEFVESQADEADLAAIRANGFRDFWNYVWADTFGSFEDTTSIPHMLYTEEPEPRKSAGCMHTLQIFSVKIDSIRGLFDWPLNVFGLVAARDVLDRKRNVIFRRTRDNCQTITQEDPYLELTGPTRAIVLLDPVYFEVDLKVKGNVESEDKDLSFLVVPYSSHATKARSFVVKRVKRSKLSTIELTLGHIVHSVEATIAVRVTAGSWPHGFRGAFTVTTASIGDMKVSNTASLEFLLLAFEDGELPATSDGMIKLSRHVACVELEGELKVSVLAQCGNGRPVVERDDKASFKPKEGGRSWDILKVGSCEIEVVIAWSLFSTCPVRRI